MTPDAVKSLKPLDRLAYWVTERDRIRLAREAGKPAPWTNDPIIQRYRFCNVRRMDDRVSRWLLTNWYEPYRDHPNMLAAAALARFVNRPDSLHLVTPFLFDDDRPGWGAVRTVLRSHRNGGAAVFNGAYMVRCDKGVDKIDYVVDCCREAAGLAVDTDSMQAAHARLLSVRGFGSFMAGQVVADMRWAVTGAWNDKNEWAPMGPGSARGLARLLYSRDEWEDVARSYQSSSPARDGPGAWLEDFRYNFLTAVKPRLGKQTTGRLEAHDYQNCLCEFDKYERALWGEGRPKQTYPGEG